MRELRNTKIIAVDHGYGNIDVYKRQHYHTFAVELAAKLLENGISTPGQLLAKLQ